MGNMECGCDCDRIPEEPLSTPLANCKIEEHELQTLEHSEAEPAERVDAQLDPNNLKRANAKQKSLDNALHDIAGHTGGDYMSQVDQQLVLQFQRGQQLDIDRPADAEHSISELSAIQEEAVFGENLQSVAAEEGATAAEEGAAAAGEGAAAAGQGAAVAGAPAEEKRVGEEPDAEPAKSLAVQSVETVTEEPTRVNEVLPTVGSETWSEAGERPAEIDHSRRVPAVEDPAAVAAQCQKDEAAQREDPDRFNAHVDAAHQTPEEYANNADACTTRGTPAEGSKTPVPNEAPTASSPSLVETRVAEDSAAAEEDTTVNGEANAEALGCSRPAAAAMLSQPPPNTCPEATEAEDVLLSAEPGEETSPDAIKWYRGNSLLMMQHGRPPADEETPRSRKRRVDQDKHRVDQELMDAWAAMSPTHTPVAKEEEPTSQSGRTANPQGQWKNMISGQAGGSI